MKNVLEKLPKREREIVAMAQEIADSQGVRVYLIGGPVRDLLLGHPPADLDFTLESGTAEFAREFSRRSGATVREFPQFLTFKLQLEGVPPIDVTTTRKEGYPKPGALPVVSSSGLRDDLFRRDFTVNALALDLRSSEIVDFFGGENDLEKRSIRVLHHRSFEDDPTRIFRGIRLARRLGFEIEPETHKLMTQAVVGGALETVSKERLWREFFLAVEESSRAKVLRDLAEEGALAALGLTRPQAGTLETIDQLLTEYGGDPRIAFLGALCDFISGGADLAGSRLSRSEIEAVQKIGAEHQAVAAAARNAKTARETLQLCEQPREMLIVAAAEEPALKPVLDRCTQLERMEMPVRGDELGLPAGVHIGQALRRTREALFLREITPEQARDFARRVAREYLEKKSR